MSPITVTRVTELSRKELEDLFEIRAMLLGLASRRLAHAVSAEALREVRAGMAALEKRWATRRAMPRPAPRS